MKSALCWPAEQQTRDRRHPEQERRFSAVSEARMTEARTSASRMNEAVKTATSKMPVCQREAQLTRGQMPLNSNPHGLRKADWSDIAFSEWWLCRDYLCEGRD